MKRETIRRVWVIFRYDGIRLTIQRSSENYELIASDLLELSESVEATYWMLEMYMAV